MTTKSMMVRVGADTRDMERGLSSAQRKIKDFRAGVNKMAKMVMVAGAAIVGSVGLMVKKYAEAGDEVHKMALRTGFSTEKLSELRYVSQICGASLASLEKGVKKMSRSIVDAADGQAEYAEAFEMVNLNAKELLKLSPEKQFEKIAKAIASVESPTIRAAAAQVILGRAGTELLPLFALGVEGFEALRQKAHKLGIVFDQEAAEKAARFTDSITTLKASVAGISRKIAEKLVPALTILAEGFSNVVSDIKLSGKDLTMAILNGFKFIIKGVAGVVMAFHAIKLGVFEVTAGTSGWLKKYLEGMAKVDEKINEHFPVLGKLLGAFGSTEGAIDTLTITENTYRAKAEETINTLANMVVFLDDVETALNNAAKAFDKIGTSGKKASETLLETTKPPAAKIADLLAAAFGVPLPAARNTARIVANVVEDMEDNVWGYKRTWEETWQAILEGARGITSGLDAVFGQFHANEATRIDNEEKRQSDALESWYERERAKIETTVTNERKKVAALEALDEEKARKENELQHKIDKERRKLERKRAKSQRMGALFSAGINMAEAITKALTAGPFIGQIMAAIVAGLCAIQIGAIAAAPLPSFKKGGDVPEDMLAYLHRGEHVLNAPTVRALGDSAGGGRASSLPNRYYFDITTIIGGERFYSQVVKIINEAGRSGDLKVPVRCVI